jgi:hypothetical protein
MTRPETPYEAASYDLNEFRERRLAERRAFPRNSLDRRVLQVTGKNTMSHDSKDLKNLKAEKE